MTDEDKDADKPKGAVKKAATKKSPPRETRPLRYVVAKGRSLTTSGRIIDSGEDITAADVADLEALIKRGFVVKA